MKRKECDTIQDVFKRSLFGVKHLKDEKEKMRHHQLQTKQWTKKLSEKACVRKCNNSENILYSL